MNPESTGHSGDRHRDFHQQAKMPTNSTAIPDAPKGDHGLWLDSLDSSV